MKVNISVCGKFHYANYIKFFPEPGPLNKFYYSHKLSTNAKTIGVRKEKLENLFLKEYLTFFHTKVLRGYHFQEWIIRYQNLWQAQLLNVWDRCDIYHTHNHGTSIEVCKLARAGGSKILGEPVNSHPENMFHLVRDEHDRLGIPYVKCMPETMLRMIEESQHFDYYLSPSTFVTASYQKRGVSADKIFTVPFGVDTDRFVFRNQKKEKFRVIYVAHITPRKAHIDLLLAWQQLKFPNGDTELIFVGHIDPVMKPLLEKYRHLFIHAGVVSNSRLVEFYNTASVFVMPSVEEGCSYSPLEAMACGVPVILTENTGCSELVTHGKEGFIVPIRSPEQIAHYIEKLYLDRDLQAEMSQHAFSKSKTTFGWESYSKKIIDIYNILLPGG